MTFCIDETTTAPQGYAQRIQVLYPGPSYMDFVVPDNGRWEVLGGFFQFYPSNVAGTRNLAYEIDDANGGRVFASGLGSADYHGQVIQIELARSDLYVAANPPPQFWFPLALPADTMVDAGWTLHFSDLFATSSQDYWSGGLWVRVLAGGIGPPPPLGVWCESFIPQSAGDADTLYNDHLERMNDLSVTF